MPGSLTVHKEQCHVCGSKVLVERDMSGIDTLYQMRLTCGECVDREQLREKAPPNVAEEIERWLDGTE